jgi:hypothetical protein
MIHWLLLLSCLVGTTVDGSPCKYIIYNMSGCVVHQICIQCTEAESKCILKVWFFYTLLHAIVLTQIYRSLYSLNFRHAYMCRQAVKVSYGIIL